MSATHAPVNDQYLVDQDSSTTFDSPVINLRLPVAAINYQFKWDPTVDGEFTWSASLYPDPYCWEQLVACDEVKFSTSDAKGTSMIVALPHVWLTQGFIMFTWTPSTGGSTGNIQAAIRVVPI